MTAMTTNNDAVREALADWPFSEEDGCLDALGEGDRWLFKHEQTVKAALAALAAKPADGWRDISTAPRDGTRVLLLDKGYVFEGYRLPDTKIWKRDGAVWSQYKPTHWMPLPHPPAEPEVV